MLNMSSETMSTLMLMRCPWLPKNGRCFFIALACSLLLPLSNASAAEPPIADIAFAPDGKSIVAVSQAGIRVLSWPELTTRQATESTVPNLHCVSFSPKGDLLAVGGGTPSVEGTVEILAWPTLKSIAVMNQHEDTVMSVAWFGETTICSASLDREIYLTNFRGEVVSSCKGHSRAVSSLCLLSDQKTVVSVGADQSLRVWNASTGKLIRSLSQHTGPIRAVALRPAVDGLPMVATAAVDRTIRFWQPTIGRMVRYIRLDSEPLDIAWSNDGSRITAACVDGHVRIVDPITVKVIHDVPAIDEWAYTLTTHPSDNSIAVGGTKGQIRRIELPRITVKQLE